VAEVEENFRLLSLSIPNDLWEELQHLKLLPAEISVPRLEQFPQGADS
jgi:hypothetical protein